MSAQHCAFRHDTVYLLSGEPNFWVSMRVERDRVRREGHRDRALRAVALLHRSSLCSCCRKTRHHAQTEGQVWLNRVAVRKRCWPHVGRAPHAYSHGVQPFTEAYARSQPASNNLRYTCADMH